MRSCMRNLMVGPYSPDGGKTHPICFYFARSKRLILRTKKLAVENKCGTLTFLSRSIATLQRPWNKESGYVADGFAPVGQGYHGQAEGARRRSRPDRTRVRQGLDHEARLARGGDRDRSHLHGLLGPRPRAEHRP